MYSQRGNIYSDMKKYDLAVDDYNNAIRLEGDNWNHYANRALVYENIHEFTKAIDYYTRAIELRSIYLLCIFIAPRIILTYSMKNMQ